MPKDLALIKITRKQLNTYLKLINMEILMLCPHYLGYLLAEKVLSRQMKILSNGICFSPKKVMSRLKIM